jgi:prophage regulatory protein
MKPETKIGPHRVLRQPQISSKVGIRRSTIYALIARGLFPKPFEIVPGGRAKGWLEADIDEWLAKRKAGSA